MSWIQFLIGVLAVHRVSLLVSSERGPGFMFAKLRRAAPKRGSLDDGLKCQLCQSLWWSVPVTGFFWWAGLVEAAWTPLYYLAFSSASICVHMQWTKEI